MPAAEPPLSELPPPILQPGAGQAGKAGDPLLQATGVLLFLFIPVVLYLFVRHPEPIAASLAAGVALMAGHRFLARPYMGWALPRKCLWCNRVLHRSPMRSAGALDPSAGALDPSGGALDPSAGALDPSSATLDLLIGGRPTAVRCCAAHLAPARRFFRFLSLARLPLRLGIFVPLLLLLGALLAAAIGWRGGPAGGPDGAADLPGARFLPAVTALFQLLVGLTVSAAAWGSLLLRREDGGGAGGDGAGAGSDGAAAPLPVPFPAHNFFLLGVRLLLWIFRLVGAWWIWRGAIFFLRASA
jgi:hypothetical protein